MSSRAAGVTMPTQREPEPEDSRAEQVLSQALRAMAGGEKSSRSDPSARGGKRAPRRRLTTIQLLLLAAIIGLLGGGRVWLVCAFWRGSAPCSSSSALASSRGLTRREQCGSLQVGTVSSSSARFDSCATCSRTVGSRAVGRSRFMGSPAGRGQGPEESRAEQVPSRRRCAPWQAAKRPGSRCGRRAGRGRRLDHDDGARVPAAIAARAARGDHRPAHRARARACSPC